MYTMRAPAGADLPLLNCTMRREVGMKRDTVTWRDPFRGLSPLVPLAAPLAAGLPGSPSLSAARGAELGHVVRL